MIRIAEPHRMSKVFTTHYHLLPPNKTTQQWKCSHAKPTRKKFFLM